MVIHSTDEKLFQKYGRVVKGYDVSTLIKALSKTPLPLKNTIYTPSCKELEEDLLYEKIKDNIYGGMPLQLGYCNGFNTKLNCLEYHRDSEINLGSEDFILLLAKREDLDDFVLDTSKVEAFKIRRGDLIEIYATTLHYAPCQTALETGFHVLVGLPRGTNTDFQIKEKRDKEDNYLFARNKWLLAHQEASEVKKGAIISLIGDNIDIRKEIETKEL